MNTRPCICDDCDGLIDGEAVVKRRIHQCPACGSEEIRDAEYDDIYRLYRESCAATAAALKAMAEAQMSGGAFQTEAHIWRARAEVAEKRLEKLSKGVAA